jgi:hypothetical protein
MQQHIRIEDEIFRLARRAGPPCPFQFREKQTLFLVGF